jgi:hypothetical protein
MRLIDFNNVLYEFTGEKTTKADMKVKTEELLKLIMKTIESQEKDEATIKEVEKKK